MIGFFTISAPLQEQEQSFVPRRFARVEHPLDPGADIAPNFFPNFLRRLSQCPGMFLTEGHLRVGIVIEEREVRPPTHPHCEAGREHHANDSLEALWPLLD